VVADIVHNAESQIGPSAHPAPNTMGTGLCPGVEQQGRGVD